MLFIDKKYKYLVFFYLISFLYIYLFNEYKKKSYVLYDFSWQLFKCDYYTFFSNYVSQY